MTDRMTRARALYLAVYESQGGQWEANDCKELWCDKADRYLELCGGVAQAPPSRKQIEAVIDDYLGNIDATYEDSRQRCAQRIVDLYAVTSTHSNTPDAAPANRSTAKATAIVGDDRESMETQPTKVASPEAGSPTVSSTSRAGTITPEDVAWAESEIDKIEGATVPPADSKTEAT